MSKKLNGLLIKSNIDESTTWMIHGTSVEATLDLLKTGIMKQKTFTEGPFQTCPEYLFFVPNPLKFKEDPKVIEDFSHYQEVWKECLALKQHYATRLGRNSF